MNSRSQSVWSVLGKRKQRHVDVDDLASLFDSCCHVSEKKKKVTKAPG